MPLRAHAAVLPASVPQDMKDGDPASLVWKTPEGIDVKPIYTKDDTAALETNQVPGPVFAGFRRTYAAAHLRIPWSMQVCFHTPVVPARRCTR